MIFLYFFITILIANLIFFINYKKISSYYNLYDFPDNIRKKHKNPTPLLGGILILINVAIYVFYELFIFSNLNFFTNNFDALIFFFFCIMFYLIGYFDDKYQIKPNLKLLLYIFLIIILMILDKDLIVRNIDFTFNKFIFNFYNYSHFFTILCFLLFINSFNMLDGINGQASSYCLFVLLSLIFLKVNSILFLSLIIPLIIFIFYNFKEKMFLGDSGTILLSFILGYFFIKSYNVGIPIYSDEIFLIMMIPGFELLRLAVQRLYKKKHPFSPDNNHVHHLLISKTNFLTSYLIIQTLLIFPFIFYLIISNSIISLIISFVLYICLIFFISKKK